MSAGKTPIRMAHVLMAAVIVAVILASFTHWTFATWVEAALLMSASLLYIPYTRGVNRWVSLALIAGCLLIIMLYPSNLDELVSSAVSGGPVLVFLALIEVLGAAINHGGFSQILTSVAVRYAHSPASVRRMAGLSALVLNFLGMFQASVPAVYYALTGNNKALQLPIALSSSRGFGAGLMANPFSPIVIMALYASGSSFSQYLLYALPVAALLLMLDWLPRRGESRITPSVEAREREASDQEHRWQRGHTICFGLAVLIFTLLYVLLGNMQVGSILQIILSLTGASLVLGCVHYETWPAQLRKVPQKSFASTAPILPLFALGGMFGGLIVSSDLLDPVLQFMQRAGNPWLEAPIVALILVFFRWIGVAPVISVLILGPLLAEVVTLPPPLYALALTFGTNAAFLSSPFSGTNLFIAQVTGSSPFTISVRYHGGYVTASFLLVSCYFVFLLM